MHWPLLGALIMLAACESPPVPKASIAGAGASSYTGPVPTYPSASRTAVSPEPPAAALLYQRTDRGLGGSSTYSGQVQVQGPVVEEVHIGNQRVYSNQPIYPPRVSNGVLQPGYVPSGTTSVFDPITGQSIPVRRR